MARRRVEPNLPDWPPPQYAGLTDFHFALLVLCGSSDFGVSPYEIELLIESGRGGVLGRSPAHVYREIRKLAERGFLLLELPAGTSRAHTYHITDEGREAAELWVKRAPLTLPATDDSVAFILIVAAQFLDKKVVWKRLLGLAYQVEERLAELDEVERVRRQNRPLTTRERLEYSLVRRLLTAYWEWLDEVRREWQMPDPRNG